MKVNDIRRIIFPLCMLAYIFAFVVTTSGAINYGCDNNAHLYTAAGILNAVFGVIIAIIAYKKDINK